MATTPNNTSSPSPSVQKAVRRALDLLDAVGALYKVVVPDGTEYGTLELAKPAPAKRTRTRLDSFSITKTFRPQVETMKVGDVQRFTIPANAPDTMNINRMQSGMCAMAVQMWGAGSVISSRIDRDTIELLRVK